ncbi:MAG: hypothetical protein ACK41Q_02005 [Candidatus Brocadia sp.]
MPFVIHDTKNFSGIGRATTSAISAFAFRIHAVFIETNIRRVFIHSFFHDRTNIRDTEILPLVEKTMDTSNPRKWYYALMDYGVMLKQHYENVNRRSAHYQKQSPFQGSNRQVRGMILKALASESSISEREIAQKFQIRLEKIKNNLIQLEKEGFITKKGKKFTLA